MKKVRIGIVGAGVIGRLHSNYMKSIENAEFVAICDTDKKSADALAAKHSVKAYYNPDKLITSGEIDAILIATPHYFHTTIGIAAFKAGLHVLVEKPISVHKADCERLIAAHNKNKKLVFSAMFMQRTNPFYMKLREIVKRGDLGEITRVNWIITTWFRSDSYYRSSDWRATWAGEGGGVLLNQCPHNLDLFQWICGMPNKVHAFASLGKMHPIEVEDEVTAYFEYPNGATGVFVTSTGESPGSNRLEICGEMGNLIVENNKLMFNKNVIGQKKFCKTTKAMFGRPEVWNIEIPAASNEARHAKITQNFINAITKGEKLIAPAEDGINSVELGNAMLYSALNKKTVDLPMNSASYERMLKNLIKNSKLVKRTKKVKSVDLSKSFA